MMYVRVVTPDRESKTAKKGKGRFFNRPTVSKGKKYPKYFIYLPVKVCQDTSFPFKDGDIIEVEIKGKTLIIRKA
ncbi:MAG: hypothetical protein QW821_05455 [Candidatus Bathyarchaeia archaeon]